MVLGSGFVNLIRISGFLLLWKKSCPSSEDLSFTRTVTFVYSRLAERVRRRFRASLILERTSARSGPNLPLRNRGFAPARDSAEVLSRMSDARKRLRTLSAN